MTRPQVVLSGNMLLSHSHNQNRYFRLMNNQTFTSFIEIDDLSLAAALYTVGYEPVPDQPFVKYIQPDGKTKYRFFLQSGSGIQEYVQAWKTEGWEFLPENEDKMFAHLKIYHKNREGLLDVVKKSSDMVVVNKNGRTAIISRNASEDIQDKIFGKL